MPTKIDIYDERRLIILPEIGREARNCASAPRLLKPERGADAVGRVPGCRRAAVLVSACISRGVDARLGGWRPAFPGGVAVRGQISLRWELRLQKCGACRILSLILSSRAVDCLARPCASAGTGGIPGHSIWTDMMKITVCEDEGRFDCTAAWRIVGQLLAKPASVIGLSTGRTTRNLHLQVGRMWREVPFNVTRVTFFGLDEVVNVPRTYKGACYRMLHDELTDHLGLPDDQLLMLPTSSDDFPEACRRFRAELARRGGADLLMLGLGENGHLGFNQPGTPFESEARVAEMDARLEERIRRETQTPPGIRLGGVTLGLKDIMHARRIVLVAKGRNKAAIVRQMLRGPVTTDVPASILQLHPACEFLLDRESAALL